MKNKAMETIKDFYNKYLAIDAAWAEAQKANDKAAEEAVRDAYAEWTKTVEAHGSDYCFIYNHYKNARERGNEYIDLDAPMSGTEEEFIATLRKFGIEKFTCSSRWSSTVEVAWRLTQNGCILEGMIEINSGSKSYGREDYDKAPAFLFRVAE